MYYKAPDNSLHFLDQEGFEYLLPEGSVSISEKEAKQIQDASQPVVVPEPIVDPLTKLKEFLAKNPDVETLIISSGN